MAALHGFVDDVGGFLNAFCIAHLDDDAVDLTGKDGARKTLDGGRDGDVDIAVKIITGTRSQPGVRLGLHGADHGIPLLSDLDALAQRILEKKQIPFDFRPEHTDAAGFLNIQVGEKSAVPGIKIHHPFIGRQGADHGRIDTLAAIKNLRPGQTFRHTDGDEGIHLLDGAGILEG